MLKLRSVIMLFLFVLTACTSLNDFDDPVVELIGIKALPAEGFEQPLQLTLKVINPNEQAFTIEGIYSELSLQGTEFVKGVSSQSVEVPAYGEATLQVNATASIMGTITLFRDLLVNPPRSGLQYELSSKLTIKNYGTVRINKEGNVEMPVPR